MSRQIKFRVWDKVGKFWVFDYAINSEGLLIHISGITKHYFPQDRCALMQFTGFHDKNERGIYEGDLIKHDNVSEPLEVYWCEATGQWKLCKGEHRHYYGCLFSYPNNLLEVVGNVCETER